MNAFFLIFWSNEDVYLLLSLLRYIYIFYLNNTRSFCSFCLPPKRHRTLIVSFCSALSFPENQYNTCLSISIISCDRKSGFRRSLRPKGSLIHFTICMVGHHRPVNVWKSMNRSIAWVGSDQKGIQKLKRGILHNRCKTTDVINQLRLIEVSYNMETTTRLKM